MTINDLFFSFPFLSQWICLLWGKKISFLHPPPPPRFGLKLSKFLSFTSALAKRSLRNTLLWNISLTLRGFLETNGKSCLTRTLRTLRVFHSLCCWWFLQHKGQLCIVKAENTFGDYKQRTTGKIIQMNIGQVFCFVVGRRILGYMFRRTEI